MVKKVYFIFAGSKPVSAFKDLWIIGDKFLNEIYHALPAIKLAAKEADEKTPYIYNQFNIKCYTSKPQSGNSSIPARLVNCMIKAMNELEKLPRIILIIPDWDILKFLDFNMYGIEELCNSVLHWIITNIKRAMDAGSSRG